MADFSHWTLPECFLSLKHHSEADLFVYFYRRENEAYRFYEKLEALQKDIEKIIGPQFTSTYEAVAKLHITLDIGFARQLLNLADVASQDSQINVQIQHHLRLCTAEYNENGRRPVQKPLKSYRFLFKACMSMALFRLAIIDMLCTSKQAIVIPYFKPVSPLTHKPGISDFEILIQGRIRGELYKTCPRHRISYFNCFSIRSCTRAKNVINLISILENNHDLTEPNVCKLMVTYSITKPSIDYLLRKITHSSTDPDKTVPSPRDSHVHSVPFRISKLK